ncbi:transposon Ty3-I Gag-Pol polyprotein [Trichonephila clavipes]|nr:transposon Ty3-I Gag-Pol polyprotein [Trichonephila clavipes]
MQLAPDKLKLEKQVFQFMLDNDIIRPSKSQWASPLHLVNKMDVSLRPYASVFTVGSVPQQFENEDWKPIAFYSKKLNDTQRRYSTYDRELLGIYLSVKHFKHLLEGNESTIYTDHKPLTFAIRQKKEKASPRQLRQLWFISEFSTNIQHVQGKDNVVADALSRIGSVATIDYDAIAEKQEHGKELEKLMQGSSSLQFKPSTLPSGKTLCRFGVPAQIITDQGIQEESQLFRCIAAIFGAKVSHTTSYHPQCNGKIERQHRTLKGAIRAHNNIKWTESLPTVLFGLRAARPDSNHTIAQMVYGTNIKLPGEIFEPPTFKMDQETFVPQLQKFMEDLKPVPLNSVKRQRIFVHKDLRSCSHVSVRVDSEESP